MTQEIEVVKAEAAGIVQWAQQLTVTSAHDCQAVVATLAKLKEIRRRWTEYWKPLKEQARQAWQSIVAREKEGTDLCDEAERIAKQKVLAWQMEQRRRAEEEQRRLQAEAEERARRERERLLRKAERLKTPEKKEQKLAEAAAVVVPEVKVEAPATPQGATLRSQWRAELVDMAALIEAAKPGTVAASFLAFDQKRADAFARSTKGQVPVPGVRFVEEKVLAVQKGGEK